MSRPPRPSPLRAALLATAAASAAACGTDPAPPDAPVSADCLEAESHSDLAFVQAKILTPGCAAFTSCHQGAATMAGGLNLEAGMARAAMVNKPSAIDPTKNLVTPGDPANSYLMIITGKYPGVIDPLVGTMPSRNPLLCAGKLDAMDRWIAAGAN
ncbi:MAG: hypothetical protein R3B48_04325 [Kofleriaceae bacterium]